MKFLLTSAEKIIGLYLTSQQSYKDVAEKEKWSLLRGEYDIFTRKTLLLNPPIKAANLQNVLVHNFYKDLINNPIFFEYLQDLQPIEFCRVQEHILMKFWERLESSISKSKVTSKLAIDFLDKIYWVYKMIKEEGYYSNDNPFKDFEPYGLIDGFEIKYDGLEEDIIVFFKIWPNFRSPIKLLTDIYGIFKDNYHVYSSKPNFINEDILLACIVTDNILSKFD